MTVTQLFILQLIAHLLSDFILQPQSWCDIKDRKIFTPYLLYHSVIVLVLSYILSFDPGFWKAAILLTLIHLILDAAKSLLIQKAKIKQLFFIDQFMHLFTIAGVVLLYARNDGIAFLFDMDTKTLAIIAGFLLCAKPANIIIKYLFRAFSIEIPVDDPENIEERSLPNAGKLIGISERFLALAFILLGQFEAVGLIIAAKSILRFNAVQKVEYVVSGTILSFSIASFTGIVINLFNSI